MTPDTRAPTTSKQGILMHACPLVRQGLLCLLSEQLPDFRFQSVDSFSDLGRQPGLTTADLVVSDLSDDEHSVAYGADWLVWLQSILGNSPLVVITEELSHPQWLALSRQPALSALALQTPQAELGPQLRQILAGTPLISPRLLPQSPPVPALARLTGGELQVFALLHAGYSVTQIAAHLHRSVKTISTHKRHLMYKLQVDNEIALFARVKNLDEQTCGLDNGQQFVRQSPPCVP
ncbi:MULTISPECIES: response regulator transcription factor [Serratia]|uniref:helix-turn-helix transcriptional regulator n=1 Tax=Serratia TaxID=613 RepID=UPI001CC00C27|nr:MULTISPECIES: response regulator transcription factor [Serratia]UAN50288.1 response regulator transcription factor [Serratia sp. JSRIV002]UAN56244.1 response regulator transcription factor [Serratia sp. JSRIV004]CAI1032395.1 Capsular synthesis regulator component B [Serratia fonticola]